MARKNASSELQKELELLVSPDEARSKLAERMEKGKKFLGLPINSEQDYKSVKNEYTKWDDFNTELLKRLFTTDKLSKEYSASAGFFAVSMYSLTLREKIRDLHKDIDDRIQLIDSIIERLELIPVSSSMFLSVEPKIPEKNVDMCKIFVVHGHDNEAKLRVARFIEKIGFEPIILHEQASGGKTIIEKIEAYSDVGFGVVIYTPCDVGAKNSEKENLNGRARQNVVFEHGFLIGKLGRSNVCSLVKGDVETPNDISGIIYTSIDNSNWQLELAKELHTAGYAIDLNKVINV